MPPGAAGDRGVWAACGQRGACRSRRLDVLGVPSARDGSAETDPSLPSWPRLNSVRPSRGNPKTGPSPESRTLPDAPRRFSLRARLAQQSPRSRACSARNPRSRRPIVVGNPKRPSFTARSVSTSRPSLEQRPVALSRCGPRSRACVGQPRRSAPRVPARSAPVLAARVPASAPVSRASPGSAQLVSALTTSRKPA